MLDSCQANIDDAVGMDVSQLDTLIGELAAPEAMGRLRDARPTGDLLREGIDFTRHARGRDCGERIEVAIKCVNERGKPSKPPQAVNGDLKDHDSARRHTLGVALVGRTGSAASEA